MGWEARAASFDRVAVAYDAHRPGYPSELADLVVERSGARPSDVVLEVGSGTGKATQDYVAHGLRVCCVEPGKALAAIARTRFGDAIELHVSTFEEYTPPRSAFRIAACAQAFHWLDREPALVKMRASLLPGGVVALYWNVTRETSEILRPAYLEHAPELGWDQPLPSVDERLAVHLAVARRVLGDVEIHRFDGMLRKSAEEYVALIDTHSDHQLLARSTRKHLYAAIRERIDAVGGWIERPQQTVLMLAVAETQ